MTSKLSSDYPWVSTPIIINAPMDGMATEDLAVAVTQAGGIGMLGSALDLDQLEARLSRTRTLLASPPPPTLLPIGVSMFPFACNPSLALPILARHPPAILWLFCAADPSHYLPWVTGIRQRSPGTRVWIQLGSVGAALAAARLCRPDVLVLQGADAGGHGFARGASVVSLVPEASDALRASGFGDVPLVAAGGVADGRGAAAALALGAAGVVMGTRFLAARETAVHPRYRGAILAAADGGVSTVRAKVFDELRGPTMWPPAYDGRALATDSYKDYVSGVGIERIRELHKEAKEGEGAGFGEENPRAAVWAGAGVGLVREVKAAAEIVEEVRSAATGILRGLSAL
ncbi:uncharacterized protein GGS25DRAFT_528879 [Hypoxylon fragiforme]|uniref:uncharacterized protein n=1 Tax=Hypoxylon fragiforme TaxID=63214 RepID=UPI0020C5E561|nr:uncharacterized protein GGS25DRAFT_528879 [Hypoxylon fragiforme]KAI2612188.1 hypothetical protein GGS25DRAFT_528879 [Hypoxylon fragiforme]